MNIENNNSLENLVNKLTINKIVNAPKMVYLHGLTTKDKYFNMYNFTNNFDGLEQNIDGENRFFGAEITENISELESFIASEFADEDFRRFEIFEGIPQENAKIFIDNLKAIETKFSDCTIILCND